MPSLWPIISKFPLKSAKHISGHESADPQEWKNSTFCIDLNRMLSAVATDMPKNVISIGDSLCERHALYHFFRTTNLKNVAIRSIKFVPLPTMACLKAQHIALAAHLPDICAISPGCICADIRYYFRTRGAAMEIDDLHDDELQCRFDDPATLELPESLGNIERTMWNIMFDEDGEETCTSVTSTKSVSNLLSRALSLTRALGLSTIHAFSPTRAKPTRSAVCVKLCGGNPYPIGFGGGFLFEDSRLAAR